MLSPGSWCCPPSCLADQETNVQRRTGSCSRRVAASEPESICNVTAARCLSCSRPVTPPTSCKHPSTETVFPVFLQHTRNLCYAVHILSCNPNNNPHRWPLLSPFYGWGHWARRGEALAQVQPGMAGVSRARTQATCAPPPLPFDLMLYCQEPITCSLRVLLSKTKCLILLHTHLHFRFKIKESKHSWKHQRWYKKARLRTNAIIKCRPIIRYVTFPFFFFFVNAIKILPGKKGSLHWQCIRHYGLETLFIQNFFFFSCKLFWAQHWVMY